MNGAPISQKQSGPGWNRSDLLTGCVRSVVLGFLTLFAFSIAGCAGPTRTAPSVSTAPLIVSQPDNQQVLVGQTAKFSVTAFGSGPLHYQWRKNEVSIPGAMSMSYAIQPTTAADDGARLSVVVTNSWGNTSSLAATLTVIPPGRLNAGPLDLNFGNVEIGSSSTLPVTLFASGGSPVTISSVGVSGPGFNVSGVPAGLILNPGQSTTLNVTFTPAATQNAMGSVPIISGGPGSPAIISLSGSGVQSVSYSVVLNWAESSATVVGYRVYRATTSGGPYGQMEPSNPTTSFTDTNVRAGGRYYYVLTSVNSSGVESKYSNEVSAAIPPP